MGVTTTLDRIGGNLEQYSFTVEVPTTDPSEFTGSTGSITMVAGPMTNPQLLRNRRFTLSDTKFGSIVGRVSEVRWSPGTSNTNFTAETVLQRLTAEVTVYPQYTLSMAASMDNVLAIAGFTSDGLPSSGVVVFPGFFGSLLDYVKHFCAAYLYEYYVDSATPGVISFRSIRSNTFSGALSSASCTINDQTLAQNVDITQYTYKLPVGAGNIEFAPAGVNEAQVLTVNAGETTEYDIQLNGWVSEVNQPVPMDLVGPAERTDSGAYCVSGSDGLPVTAAQWVGQGGELRVKITEDPSVLRVTVVAPNVNTLKGVDGKDTFAPYSIAATAVDDNTLYNSLHITGKGVRYTSEVLRLPTGAVSDVTIQEVGATVTNPFLSTRDMVYRSGLRAAQTYAGPTYTFTGDTTDNANYLDLLGAVVDGGVGSNFRVTSVTVNPSGESLSGKMDTTIADFNSTWSGKTFADFNSAWGAITFAQFNTEWQGTTFGQFNTAWAGKTFEDFNAETGYLTFGSFAASPLLLDPKADS